jgi:hypothetical protein
MNKQIEAMDKEIADLIDQMYSCIMEHAEVEAEIKNIDNNLEAAIKQYQDDNPNTTPSPEDIINIIGSLPESSREKVCKYIKEEY